MSQFKKNFRFLVILVSIFSTSALTISPPQPFNFTQNKNWCWMTAALQCFYRMEDFRETVKKIGALNIEPNTPQYEPWIFFRRLDAVFTQLEKERCDLKSFYDFVFTKKLPEHEIVMKKEFLDNYLNTWKTIKLEQEAKNAEALKIYLEKLKQDPDLDEELITNSYANLKSLLIQSSLTDLTTTKYAQQNEPFKFVLFIYGALKIFQKNLGSDQLIRWTSVDFMGTITNKLQNIHELMQRKTPRKILIVHYDGILDETITLHGQVHNLVGMCMNLPGHYIAVVKYENQWVKLDSCGGTQGENLGTNLTQVLSNLHAQDTSPTQYFYQIDNSLKSNLARLRKKLILLKSKLNDLTQALTQLRSKLKINAA